MLTLALILAGLSFFVWSSGRLGPPEVPPPGAPFEPVAVVSEAVSPAVGYLAPDFEGSTLEGKPIRLSGQRRRAVFLNFWAPWCGPCRMEMAAIGRLHAQASEDLRILTIAVDSNEAHVRRFLEKLPMKLPVIHDAQGELGARFQISGIPTSLLIDPRGVVVLRIVGPRAWDRPEFLAWASSVASTVGE
jgi:thiol-disulfide isomerase/thioredoxin